MRRSVSKLAGLCDGDSSNQNTAEFNLDQFISFYKPLLEKFFGCCLEEILKTVEKFELDEQKACSNICLKLFQSNSLSDEETSQIIAILKQTYEIIFSQIDSSQSISHIVCSSADFETYKFSIQKLPRLLFIFRELNKVSNDKHIISTSFELLKLISNHIVLPESTRERLENSTQNIGVTINSVYIDQTLPSSKLLDILFCGNLPGHIDNFASFKPILHSKADELYLLFSPLIGLDAANIYYTSSPLEYGKLGVFKYFEYFQHEDQLVAISALRQPHYEILEQSAIETISLPEEFKLSLARKYSTPNIIVNRIERYISQNIGNLLSLPMTKSLLVHDRKTITLYELPEIDDLFYGHRFTQELIAECIVTIEKDMHKNGLASQPLIINCEKGTNRSKAIYEAMVELKHRDQPELKCTAIKTSLPEIMTHFSEHNLSEYIYLGYDEEGSKISLIKDLVLTSAQIGQQFER
jgi:hypothetical protein